MKTWLIWIIYILVMLSLEATTIEESQEKKGNCCEKNVKRVTTRSSIGHVVLYQNVPGPNVNQGYRESPGHALDRHQREFYRQGHFDHGIYGRYQEEKRLKPGLLQVQLQLPASGAVVAQGSHGEHHVIHNLPEHYLGRPGDPVYFSQYSRNAPQNSKTHQHREPVPVIVKEDQIKEHLYQYPVDELSKALAHKLYHPKFVQLYREVVEEYFRDKFGITDLSILRSEKRPIRPSVEFYEYSEPDPLYHSDGVLNTVTSPNLITPTSLLTTHNDNPSEQIQNDHHVTSDSENLDEYVTDNKRVPASTESPITNTYPDSINAQLGHFEGDTNVPYVAATANTESPLESTVQTLPSEYSFERTSPLVTETTLIIEVEQAKVTELDDQTLTLTTHSATTTNEKRQIPKGDLKNGNFTAKNDRLLDSMNSQENNKITKTDINKETSPLISDTKSVDSKNISVNEKINHSTNEIVFTNSTEFNKTSLNNDMIKTENKNSEKIGLESEKLVSKKLMNSSVGKYPMTKDNFDELGHLVLKLVNNAKEQNKEENRKKSR